MVTLHDVAQKAGVSPTTVSRVVNNKHTSKVSARTRAHVLQVVQDLGYKPNLSARGLRLKSTFNFGLVVQNVNMSFSPNIVEGIQREAMSNDYGCLLYSTFDDAQVEADIFRVLARKHVDGIIWVPGTDVSPMLSRFVPGIPVLQLLYKELDQFPALRVDQEKGQCMATTHLIELGHSKIAYISGRKRHGQQRYVGYCTALQQAGIQLDTGLVNFVDSWEEGYHNVRQLLTSRKDITAIAASSDILALYVRRAAQDLGMQVPQDLSIVGFDDLPLLYFLDQPLTTIAQPKKELGELAMRTLIKMIKKQHQSDITVDPYLLKRTSTAPPRTGS